MKKLISLIALIGACSANNAVVRHESESIVMQQDQTSQVVSRSEELHWWGYRITDGDISYEHNTRTYTCTLRLGNDAKLEDQWCNNTVDRIQDNQGYQSCFYNAGTSRCNLANEILAKKKQFLREEETHQRWVETGGEDVLREYTN